MASSFGLPDNYEHRLEPSYFDDETNEIVWQPDVYAVAGSLAEETGRRTIVDLGCGSGRKLARIKGFDVIAVDIPGPNLELAGSNVPQARTIGFDLGKFDELPIEDATLSTALVICSDVVEHIPDPTSLIRYIARAVELGALAVLSSPERRLTWGSAHHGPPPNAAHCREWALHEFVGLLRGAGLVHLAAGITRSNDASPLLATMLVAAFPTAQLADQHRTLVEALDIADAIAALMALRDEQATLEATLARMQAHDDESQAWHAQHLAETDDWYRSKIESLESQLAELNRRLSAEIDHRERIISELRATNADLVRASEG